MEATLPGPNRTGAAIAAEDVKLMLEAVEEFSPAKEIDTHRSDIERQAYITIADSVGSIPAPRGAAQPGAQVAVKPAAMALLMDKLGERLAFERTGTRLYDALITKCLALSNEAGASEDGGSTGSQTLLALRAIRAQELAHFQLLTATIRSLGGDPTAQTPCADVTAAASMGLMQVLTDPRTTLAQCLNTILTAELTDNAGWELLTELAENAGHADLTKPFGEALKAEAQHLTIVRGLLRTTLMTEAGSPAV